MELKHESICHPPVRDIPGDVLFLAAKAPRGLSGMAQIKGSYPDSPLAVHGRAVLLYLRSCANFVLFPLPLPC